MIFLSFFTGEEEVTLTVNGKSFALNLASMHEIREVIWKRKIVQKKHRNARNSLYATDSYFVYVLKMEYVSKIKNDCEKWSRIFLKSLHTQSFFSGNIFYFIESRLFQQNSQWPPSLNDLPHMFKSPIIINIKSFKIQHFKSNSKNILTWILELSWLSKKTRPIAKSTKN